MEGDSPKYKNMIKCNRCQDIIESKYTHDFKWCKCNSVAVDGGQSYFKRCGYPKDYTELYELLDIPDKK